MKTNFFLIVFMLMLKSVLFAQWTNILTNNANNFQSRCFATTKDTCFVGDASGKIFRTTDGGSTWDSVQTIFTTSWFNDLYFPSKNVGYACGGTAFGNHNSLVAKTTNGGVTWDSLTSNAFIGEFVCMSFLTDDVGYIAGNDFVKTTDGGQNFSTISIPFFYNVINSMYFFNPDTGIVSIRNYETNPSRYIHRLLRTQDGGTSWTTVFIESTLTSSPSKNISAISFYDQLNGFAVGDNGNVLRTSNGGLAWFSDTIADDSITYFTGISFSKNSLTGYVAGWKYLPPYEGCIYKTTDGGLTWQLNFSTPENLLSISMATDEIGYTSGYRTIFKTVNGGMNFIYEPTNDTQPFVFFPNPSANNFMIQFDKLQSNYELNIYDSKGTLLKQVRIDEQCKTIDTQNLSNGVYNLVLLNGIDHKTWTQKLILMK